MNGRARTYFRRLNISLPWLKIALIILMVMSVKFVAQARPQIFEDDEMVNYVAAPMLKHVKVPERPWRNLTGKKLVALTFDDGPSGYTTPQLLDILREKNVPATFFELGSMMQNHPEIVLREIEEGHEVESHTMWHQDLASISLEDVIYDVEQAKEVYRNILGYEPRFIRPPYGSYDYKIEENAGVPLITWSVDSLDWKYKNTESILDYGRRYLEDGGIVLMHDIHQTTVNAIASYIDILRDEGFEFVTVAELISLRKATVEPGVVYGSFYQE